MDLYDKTSDAIARLLTQRYSTSFSSASRLFPAWARGHIYNIYGLVRIADELVDTYRGPDAAKLLEGLEQECYTAIKRGYSINPIVHAYANTARACGINDQLLGSFFESMRMDLTPHKYTQGIYHKYIYGSAEVVGLMCLRVFCLHDPAQYDRLAPGAQRLGAAYQKVNFLRDIAADHDQLGRFYFPDTTFERFDDVAKSAVTADIHADFAAAAPYVADLPKPVRPAVLLSYRYYVRLLTKLQRMPASHIKAHRVRLPAHEKAWLMATRRLKVRP